MKNVIKMENPRQVREQARDQACEWLSRLDAGATTKELQALDDWLEENPVHVEEFLKMAEFWDDAIELSELSSMFPLEKFTSAGSSNKGRRMLFVSACAAATGIVAAVGMSRLGLLNQLPGINVPDNFQASYETPVGEQVVVNLPDNSRLILNTNSRVEVKFENGMRNITLVRGESHFDVERDVQRPFKVYAGNRVVEAVGTAFSVQKSVDDSVSVLVTEGKVNFSSFQDAVNVGNLDTGVDSLSLSSRVNVVSLVAGEFALAQNSVADTVEKQQMAPEEIEARLAWRQGMLQFKGEPLGKVIEQISRYTTVVIEAEQEIIDIEVEGYFRARDIEGILRALQNNFKITIQRIDENHIMLASSE